MIRAKQQRSLWAVVQVESGIPVTVELYWDRRSAEEREMSLRADMNPDDDETGLFEVELPGASPEKTSLDA